MIEAGFWTDYLGPLLKRQCQELRLHAHFERVENAVGVGDPDVDYCIEGAAGKIELKYATSHPARPATPVLGRGNGMRRSQIIWACRRLAAGGRVFLAIGTPDAAWVINLKGYTPQDMGALELASAPRLREICAWHRGSGVGVYLPPTLTN